WSFSFTRCPPFRVTPIVDIGNTLNHRKHTLTHTHTHTHTHTNTHTLTPTITPHQPTHNTTHTHTPTHAQGQTGPLANLFRGVGSTSRWNAPRLSQENTECESAHCARQ